MKDIQGGNAMAACRRNMRPESFFGREMELAAWAILTVSRLRYFSPMKHSDHGRSCVGDFFDRHQRG